MCDDPWTGLLRIWTCENHTSIAARPANAHRDLCSAADRPTDSTPHFSVSAGRPGVGGTREFWHRPSVWLLAIASAPAPSRCCERARSLEDSRGRRSQACPWNTRNPQILILPLGSRRRRWVCSRAGARRLRATAWRLQDSRGKCSHACDSVQRSCRAYRVLQPPMGSRTEHNGGQTGLRPPLVQNKIPKYYVKCDTTINIYN